MKPIFRLSNSPPTFALYVALMACLTLITFGSLSDHLFDAYDDIYHMQDAARIQTDFSFLFSTERILEIRPPVDLIFQIGYALWKDNPAGYHVVQVCLHLIAALLLAGVFRQLGTDLELSLFASLLFLMNVAHFWAVYQINGITYNLTLIFGGLVLIAYIRFLNTRNLLWMSGAICFLSAAMFSHPSAVSIPLFCVYLTWRNKRSIKETVIWSWPLLAGTLAFGFLVYLATLHADQIRGVVGPPDFRRLLINPFWYLGRLLTSAHWLTPTTLSSIPNFWEAGIGILGCIGACILYRSRQFPAADCAVWSLLSVLPFVHYPSGKLEIGPSRHLYLASAGSSFVLAWALRLAVDRTEKWLNRPARQIFLLLLIVCLTLSSIFSLTAARTVSFYRSGKGYIARGQPEIGLDQLSRAISQEPHLVPPDAYARLAITGFTLGKSSEHILKDALARYPNVPYLRVLLDLCAFLDDNPERQRQAEKHIQDILKEGKDGDQIRLHASQSFLNMGAYHHRKGHLDRSLNLYRRALHMRPKYTEALYNIAHILHIQGHPEEAIQTYQKAIEINPLYTQALQNLGNLLSIQGRLEEAIQAYQKAIQTDPGAQDIHFNLGMLQYKLEQYAQAAAALHQAVRLSQNDWQAHLNLARTYEKLDRIEESMEAYRRVLALNPGNIAARTGLQSLIHRQPSQ